MGLAKNFMEALKKPSIPINYSKLETVQISSAINLIGETMYEIL